MTGNIDIKEYGSMLVRLKRNKENVPLELFTTKYGKSNDQLRDKIRSMTKEILQAAVLGELKIERSHTEERYLEINIAIREIVHGIV